MSQPFVTNTANSLITLGPHRILNPACPNLCGRSIVKKQDFCSSDWMRLFVIGFALFACIGQSHAFSCNDFKSEFAKFRDEADVLEQQYKQLPNIRFLHCQHVQFKLVPHLKKKAETFRSFAGCTGIGMFAELYVSETEKHIAEVKKPCE